MRFRGHRGPSAATLVDDLLRALAYAEARATDGAAEHGAEQPGAGAAPPPPLAAGASPPGSRERGAGTR